MSNIQVEGFGTYGAVTDTNTSDFVTRVRPAMLGAYAEVSNLSGGVVSGLPWFADGRFWAACGGFDAYQFRRVLPEAMTKALAAFRFAVESLPPGGKRSLFQWRNAGNLNIAHLRVTPTGALEIAANGDDNPLLVTSGPVVQPETTYHVEFMCEPATGSVEVRLDGAAVLQASALTLGSPTPLASWALGGAYGGPWRYITDIIIRSFTGTYNNGFLGERGVATLMVASDDPAHQGWTPRPLQKFGTGVLQNIYQTSGGYPPQGGVTAPQSTDFDFGTGDFTVEGFFRFDSLPTGTKKSQLFGKWREDTNQRSWRLYKAGPLLHGATTRFEISTAGTAGTTVTVIDWPWQPDPGQYYHIAVVRASGNTMLFIDGVMQGLPVADANAYFAANAPASLMGQFTSSLNSVADTAVVGWQDEFRLTKGVARYTANFTPPAAAFPRNVGGDPDFASVKWLSGWDSGVFDESSVGRVLSAVDGARAIAPNDAPAAYMTLRQRNAPLDYQFIQAALINAEGLFTMTANLSNGDTITVGTKDGSAPAVYTLKTALASAYDVLVGASLAETAANIAAAINQGAGEGTVYGTGTLANFDVAAQVLPSNQVQVTANVAGTAGNSIATTDTSANGAWGAATLQGGADIPPYSQFGWQRLPIKTTVVDSVTLVTRAWKTESGPASIQQSFVGPAGAAANGQQRQLGTAPGYYFDTFEEDPDTSAPLTPTTVVSGKQRINRLT